MSRSTLRARNAIIGAVSLAVLAVAPAAQAYPGDWSISGEFERTTTPSFAGGFNPNDVDEFSAAYDNRAKTLAIDLDYFQVPGRDNVYISFGTGLPDGSCNTGAIDVTIASRDITSTRTSRVWVPAQWYNSEGRHYWRDGYWAIRTDTSVDAEHYDRVATLERDGVDGSLEQVARLDSDETEMGWTFGSPLLNGLAADCVEITVPGRRAPFVIAPPAAPVVDPAPPTGTTPTP
ncbi:MAG: YXWGXW repeat-containing protein, partial [Thermoleophilia bacterium]|nr:YXWGXW repeat-containing protein [Thermoleophilia bacterium]